VSALQLTIVFANSTGNMAQIMFASAHEVQMDDWDEIKTAYQVARVGTVSGAAEVLGVHHATVIRHIDALEGRLGVKLFQRHPRGYTATEAGEDLLRVAKATDDQFNQMVGRIKGRGSEVSGDLVVTSLTSLAPQIAPMLAAFQKQHKDVVVRYLTSSRLFRLEYGEAHVAIRAGLAPDQPDNVVQPMLDLQIGAYASGSYVAEYGMPEGPQDYGNHRFVGADDLDNRAPYYKWLRENVPESSISYRTSDTRAAEVAVRAGAGIGFLVKEQAEGDPGLVEIYPPRPEWAAPIWLVTHVDLHRTTKVQALLRFIKEQMQQGPQ
jgi:DNA-binding transcriptional LysR family regulator